jgi:hypothetical protein
MHGRLTPLSPLPPGGLAPLATRRDHPHPHPHPAIGPGHFSEERDLEREREARPGSDHGVSLSMLFDATDLLGTSLPSPGVLERRAAAAGAAGAGAQPQSARPPRRSLSFLRRSSSRVAPAPDGSGPSSSQGASEVEESVARRVFTRAEGASGGGPAATGAGDGGGPALSSSPGAPQTHWRRENHLGVSST